MFSRTLTFDILQGAQDYPIVGLLGSRQSGKTVLAQQIFSNYGYVSLKDIELRTAATLNPRTFIKANRTNAGLIIDDFHHAPELLSYMQTEEPTHKGEYVLCGPQNAYTRELIMKRFEGTISIHNLFPLSLRELTENFSLPHDLNTILYKGLHPEGYTSDTEPQTIYRNYLSLYIDKDIQLFGQVDNVTTFHTFFKACAAKIGQVLNITTLANEASISDHTARRWLGLLEDHQMVFLVKPYPEDFGKRLIKSPKLYFYDPGIARCLLGIPEEQLPTHPMRKPLFESLIMSELIKWTSNLYFWKDKTHQVDCIIQEGAKSIPLGIQNASTFKKDRKHWHKLSQTDHSGYTILTNSISDSTEQISWDYLQPLCNAINLAR